MEIGDKFWTLDDLGWCKYSINGINLNKYTYLVTKNSETKIKSFNKDDIGKTVFKECNDNRYHYDLYVPIRNSNEVVRFISWLKGDNLIAQNTVTGECFKFAMREVIPIPKD